MKSKGGCTNELWEAKERVQLVDFGGKIGNAKMICFHEEGTKKGHVRGEDKGCRSTKVGEQQSNG